MAIITSKNKKARYYREDRPEYQNVLQSLSFLKDFGYVDLWTDDMDFVRSFNMGCRCAKYIGLIHFLENELKSVCKSPEMAQFKYLLSVLRHSAYMHSGHDILYHPVFFRLNSVNYLATRLLQLYLIDVHNHNSLSMKKLFKSVCKPPPPLPPKQEKPTHHPQTSSHSHSHGHSHGHAHSQRHSNGQRSSNNHPPTTTSKGNSQNAPKSKRVKDLRSLRKALQDQRVVGRSRSPRRMMIDELFPLDLPPYELFIESAAAGGIFY